MFLYFYIFIFSCKIFILHDNHTTYKYMVFNTLWFAHSSTLTNVFTSALDNVYGKDTFKPMSFSKILVSPGLTNLYKFNLVWIISKVRFKLRTPSSPFAWWEMMWDKTSSGITMSSGPNPTCSRIFGNM